MAGGLDRPVLPQGHRARGGCARGIGPSRPVPGVWACISLDRISTRRRLATPPGRIQGCGPSARIAVATWAAMSLVHSQSTTAHIGAGHSSSLRPGVSTNPPTYGDILRPYTRGQEKPGRVDDLTGCMAEAQRSSADPAVAHRHAGWRWDHWPCRRVQGLRPRKVRRPFRGPRPLEVCRTRSCSRYARRGGSEGDRLKGRHAVAVTSAAAASAKTAR